MRKITATRTFNVDDRYCEAERISHKIAWELFKRPLANYNCTIETIKKECKIPAHLNGGIEGGIAKTNLIGLTIYRPITKKEANVLCEVAEKAYKESLP